jgi:hypothetical protein
VNRIENLNIAYVKSDNLLQDVQQIIETAQDFTYKVVNIALLQRNWLLGKRIAEEELQGKERAEYGAEIIKKLSLELTQIYGKGFTKSNLYTFTEFYNAFPKIFQSPIGKSFSLLTWTHYFILLQVKNPEARDWYMHEAAEQTWSVRTPQRNISSQYYFRLLQSQNKDLVRTEMREKPLSF